MLIAWLFIHGRRLTLKHPLDVVARGPALEGLAGLALLPEGPLVAHQPRLGDPGGHELPNGFPLLPSHHHHGPDHVLVGGILIDGP